MKKISRNNKFGICRFIQFRIVTILILVFFVSLPLAYFARYQKHFRALKTLQANNAEIRWTNRAPDWLEEWLGDYRFGSVCEVYILDHYGEDTIDVMADLESLYSFQFLVEGRHGYSFQPLKKFSNSLSVFLAYHIPDGTEEVFCDFTELEDFCLFDDGIELWSLAKNKRLHSLCIECNDDAEGLEVIREFKSLRCLTLKHPPNIEPLADMVNLESLLLHLDEIDNVTPFLGLKKLTVLELPFSKIPEDGKVALRAALPQCEIYFED